MSSKIAVIGLGYVGLPVAVAFAKKFPGTIGFDVNKKKVLELQDGFDATGEVDSTELKNSKLVITDSTEQLKACNFFVVAVPTPVNKQNRPDLTCLERASETVGKVIQKGSYVVYESTVYPGVTEDICGPIIEKVSGLKRGVDFKLGYSPERINPGDKLHTLEKIIKVVSGEDQESLEVIANTYAAIIDAGVFKATSIKVAEAAKVIENTQRDLNIALMNELALIFDRMGIATTDVLAAAGTKWNFLKFFPGLVGGHCIGVDPYYLTSKAEELGYQPQVILSGRRINDGMGSFVAQKLIKMLVHKGEILKNAKIAIYGITFKEDVPDIRNSRVPDIINELKDYGITPLVYDPCADKEETLHEYGLELCEHSELANLDAAIIAVSHKTFINDLNQIVNNIKKDGIVIDVKSICQPDKLRSDLGYWRL
jgi:UDP-N-acetyl-D-galactosamine dehydrogenase